MILSSKAGGEGGGLFGLNGYVPHNRVWFSGSWVLNSRIYSAIFLWPWNENSQTKQRQLINKRKWSDLIGLSNGCKRVWLWLVKRTLRRKNFMPENILEIALTSYCNTISQLIEQCLLQIRGFLWRENEESMFWSFHPLADKTSRLKLVHCKSVDQRFGICWLV